MALLMRVLSVRAAEMTYPTGDKSFSVLQCFPSAFPPEESDPFLMCDEFGPKPSTGQLGPDVFPVDWHPHRGQDLLTYMVQGRARHADSMGNRATVMAPGMQWMQAGSGIEHAEGGGSPKGEIGHGFQIWINVPSDQKMTDPAYGTVPTKDIPVHKIGATTVRVIAGDFTPIEGGPSTGPFETRVKILMLDLVLAPGATFSHDLSEGLDNCLLYFYGPEGSGNIGGYESAIEHGVAAHFDATDPKRRRFELTAGDEGLSVLVFAGKKLHQKVAWHGPFVMTTDEEIRKTIHEYRSGTFLRKTVEWDYKVLSKFPPELRAKALATKDEL